MTMKLWRQCVRFTTPHLVQRVLLALGVALHCTSFAETKAPPTSNHYHTAAITKLAVDRSNKVLATVSEDKSLRIWELATGKPLRVINPPVGEGDLGKLFAVALSPDGKTVACAGFTGQKNRVASEGYIYYDYEIYVGSVLILLAYNLEGVRD
jgi:WD40 repeat protein